MKPLLKEESKFCPHCKLNHQAIITLLPLMQCWEDDIKKLRNRIE